MATEATTAREQAIAAARLSIETIMAFDGLPQPDVEQQVRLLIEAHEKIVRLQDQPEYHRDGLLEELAHTLRQMHLEIFHATSSYIAYPIDAVGTYFGVEHVQCNGYSTYIARSREALMSMVANAEAAGYHVWHSGPSQGSQLDLYAGGRGSHRVMLYGPVAEQHSA